MLKKIQGIANVAIIITSALLCAALIKNSLLPRALTGASSTQGSPASGTGPAASKPSRASIQIGTNISLAGIDFTKHERTLLFALSTTCRFCTESSELYKRLEKERSGNVRFVAVLPQPVVDGREYLNSLGVRVDEVVQAQLNSIGLRGTPTLILIDDKGAVSDYWVGKLANDEEERLIRRLREGAKI